MEEAPPQPGPTFNLDEKTAEAESLVARGGYVHLRRAFTLYQDIERNVPDKSRFAAGYAMTALLLAARAKEMGVRNDGYLAKARELVQSEEVLAALAPAIEVVGLIPVRTLGVWDDSPGQEAAPEKKHLDLEPAGADPTARPADGPFFAYAHALSQEQSGEYDAAKADLDGALRMYPDSLLLKFKRAILPPADLRLLEEIAEREPEFFESFLGQGQLALAGGALITAEKHLLRAQDGVPESPLIAILLASVNFGTEEYDRSLAFYDKTLDLAPAYKEARLGKAICLSCLGRPTEAIPILEDLLARGPALKGECLFWLATNLREIGDREKAAAEVEKAKVALPVARVFTLAGTIAFERGFLDAAEKDLKIAVGLDTGESEAFFGLGKLYARRSVWIDSALNFMFAGYGFESEEKKILAKIGQVEESMLPEERKGRLLARKKYQLEKTRLTKATAQFNAAAGYYNAGDLNNALTWVRSAAAHPYFAGKGKEFMALISSRN
jgi:tetratricopeptide (TPR) repeat protein